MHCKIFKRLMSLKGRLIIILGCSAFIPIFCIGTISYYSIYELVNTKLNVSLSNELSSTCMQIDNLISNLSHTSQQVLSLVLNNEEIFNYFASPHPVRKMEMMTKIDKEIRNIEFSNPNLSNISIFTLNEEGVYESINTTTITKFPNQNPLLSLNAQLTYYGPHKTQSVYSDYQVISLKRTISVKGYPNILVYIETGFKKLDGILLGPPEQIGLNAVISQLGKTVYCSGEPALTDISIEQVDAKGELQLADGSKYFTLTKKSHLGWSLARLVPKSIYDKEKGIWKRNYAIISVISISISTIFAYIIWRMVYVPTRKFYTELKSLTADDIENRIEKLNVKEFDDNLMLVNKMKDRVVQLMHQVEIESNERSLLEVKQLYYKINPHFLHNTLDTLKWFAYSEQSPAVAEYISSLNKFLVYNLEEDVDSNLEKELLAVREYVSLQQIKYTIALTVDVTVPNEMMQVRMPRFALQPIVENAIYHGIEGDGSIDIKIHFADDYRIAIIISDDGVGMSQKTIDAILNTQYSGKSGIGVNYVKTLIKHIYGDKCSFNIRSELGKGTEVELIIPY